MFDNFGVWEFLFLALLALLFFGPERLPQIGARLGRWLNSLTRYSKAFMTQWSEEAMAIQDAVEEMRGIRDDILAAQAEIASSLDSARGDIDQTLAEARGVVREATPNPAQALAETPSHPRSDIHPTKAAASPEGEEAAIAKSQQIVQELLEKRPPRHVEVQEPTAKVETTPHEEPVALAQASPTAEAEATLPEMSATEEPASTESPKPEAAEPTVRVEGEAQEEHKPARAFDRTQEILERLKRRRAGEETPEERSDVVPVRYDEFESLRRQVFSLEKEIESLRRELRSLRSEPERVTTERGP